MFAKLHTISKAMKGPKVLYSNESVFEKHRKYCIDYAMSRSPNDPAIRKAFNARYDEFMKNNGEICKRLSDEECIRWLGFLNNLPDNHFYNIMYLFEAGPDEPGFEKNLEDARSVARRRM